MRCEEVQAAIVGGSPGPAEFSHLQQCPHCRAAQPGLEELRAHLSEPWMWDEPSPGTLELVTARLPGRLSRPKRMGWWLGAAAALVAVTLGAGWWLNSSPDPDWELRMTGSQAFANAWAEVRGYSTDAGTRMELVVHHLPAAPPGWFYEMWLSSDAGAISAGSFTSSRSLELWAGVRRRDFPRLWVTLEPADGVSTPSGEMVLVG